MELSLIGILLALIIIGVVFWAARALIAAFGIPQPIATVIYVILVLVALFWILSQLGVGPGIRITR
jgi:choline-glycine betaine transporter